MCQVDRETLCYGKILMRQGTVARYLKSVTDAYDACVKVVAKRLTPVEAEPIDSAGEAALASVRMPTTAQLEAAQAKLRAEVNDIVKSEGREPDKLESIGEMSDLFEGLRAEVMLRRHTDSEIRRSQKALGEHDCQGEAGPLERVDSVPEGSRRTRLPHAHHHRR